MNEPRLCYVRGSWAYFTTQEIGKQWGDDWNDAPYEHNAGTPYEDYESDRDKKPRRWEITKVAFDGGLNTPDTGHANSPWSVEQINKGAVAWLMDRYGQSGVIVKAGVTIPEFKELVYRAGGSVYFEDPGGAEEKKP